VSVAPHLGGLSALHPKLLVEEQPFYQAPPVMGLHARDDLMNEAFFLAGMSETTILGSG
jgi:hypothetical protein